MIRVPCTRHLLSPGPHRRRKGPARVATLTSVSEPSAGEAEASTTPPGARQGAEAPGEGKTSRYPGSQDPDIIAFVEQARWLVDYHGRRSDSFSTRAVALLGFGGVMLALVVRTSLPAGIKADTAVKVAIPVTLGFLVLGACCSLFALWPRKLSAPGVKQLRDNWSSWVNSERRDHATFDIAETFLGAKDLTKPGVLDSNYNEPNGRAMWFRAAAVCMVLSVVSLTVVLTDLYMQAF